MHHAQHHTHAVPKLVPTLRQRAGQTDGAPKEKNDGEQVIPEYHLDYCFPGDEEGQKLTTLVAV